ncbi:hypothetical protein NGRA_1686 [Nosema granulosis]|uniref:Uncharacterized protein n=1 Tax=Nosema granulosis TaxID=83296 RepID=A0A9P6GYZ6_9MICR|nr:hypothetical protein NGRA_1686 [Nosema granulosis]
MIIILFIRLFHFGENEKPNFMITSEDNIICMYKENKKSTLEESIASLQQDLSFTENINMSINAQSNNFIFKNTDCAILDEFLVSIIENEEEKSKDISVPYATLEEMIEIYSLETSNINEDFGDLRVLENNIGINDSEFCDIDFNILDSENDTACVFNNLDILVYNHIKNIELERYTKKNFRRSLKDVICIMDATANIFNNIIFHFDIFTKQCTINRDSKTNLKTNMEQYKSNLLIFKSINDDNIMIVLTKRISAISKSIDSDLAVLHYNITYNKYEADWFIRILSLKSKKLNSARFEDVLNLLILELKTADKDLIEINGILISIFLDSDLSNLKIFRFCTKQRKKNLMIRLIYLLRLVNIKFTKKHNLKLERVFTNRENLYIPHLSKK